MTVSLPHSVDDFLLRHAAGALDAGFSLLVETHLELSPSAREVHAEFEALGGALLEEIAPVNVDASALNKALFAIDGLGAPVHREAKAACASIPPCRKVSHSPSLSRNRRSGPGDGLVRAFAPHMSRFPRPRRLAPFCSKSRQAFACRNTAMTATRLPACCVAAFAMAMRVIAKATCRMSTTEVEHAIMVDSKMFLVSV